MIETIYPVTHSTKHVGPGSIFVAIKGARHNGVDYIPHALELGARCIVVQDGNSVPDDIVRMIQQAGCTLTYVSNARKALAELSASALNYPARHLKIIGVTGTKGKTTTACFLAHVLQTAGYKTALLTTVHNKIGDTVIPSELTTAHPDYIHMFLRACVDESIEFVVMEVAAQALSLHRVYGIEFDGAIFTNFSQEHGEFYPSLHDYFDAKCQLIGQCKREAPIVVNTDDEWCAQLVHTYAHCVPFGTGTDYDVTSAPMSPSLPGLFNAYNIMGALALAAELGIDQAGSVHACETFEGVPGRMQRYPLSNGAMCYIDYAHNPSSFEAVFSTLRPLTDDLIVVFGCGGDRDKDKRPVMGEVAARYADCVILTSDDPRSEDPLRIIKEIQRGVPLSATKKISECVDRQQAIESAYKRSRKGSIIVLLGKGPCEYQEINGVKYPLSERAIIQRLHAGD